VLLLPDVGLGRVEIYFEGHANFCVSYFGGLGRVEGSLDGHPHARANLMAVSIPFNLMHFILIFCLLASSNCFKIYCLLI
jgi:hypothetical protein